MGDPVVDRLTGTVAGRLAEVRRRIEVAGGGRAVRVVAVTKGVAADLVAAALHAGVSDFGENYAEELLAKAAVVVPVVAPVESSCRWHFLGAVQRRKVRDLAPTVACWQSVDRLSAGQEIARRAPGATVLVQVEITGRPGRNGCAPDQAATLVERLRETGLNVAGLMAVGDRSDPRPGFRRLADLGRRLELAELSMGMSDDLEVAVNEGSTIVRVGRALFGPRPGPEDLRRYPHP
ncbi:MAG: alanine racemase, partial [Acidimicrobiales bacterium]